MSTNINPQLEQFLLTASANNNSNSINEEDRQHFADYERKLEAYNESLENSIEIEPLPGFVCKAKIRNNEHEPISNSQKVFLNICSHALIGEMSPENEQIRIPMSCGAVHYVNDSSGQKVQTFDVVFHPSVVQKADEDKEFKIYVCQLAAANIRHKTNKIIDEPYKFPKSSYKINQSQNQNQNQIKKPMKQRINKQRAAKLVQVQPAQNANNYNSNHNNNNFLSNANASSSSSPNQNHNNSRQSAPKSKSKPNSNSNQKSVQHSFNPNSNLTFDNCVFIVIEKATRKKLVFHRFTKLYKYCQSIQNLNNIVSLEFCIQLRADLRYSDLELVTDEHSIELLISDLELDVNGAAAFFYFEWRYINEQFETRIDEELFTGKYIQNKHVLKIKCPVT